MRKISGIIILICSTLVLLTAMNQSFINRIKRDRYFDHLQPTNTNNKTLYQQIFIRSDRWRYGDLYGLSYLPQYKSKLEPFKQYNKNDSQNSSNRLLYIIGDSFLADKDLSKAFDGFDKVIFLDRRFSFGPIKLDSTKQNYLIMEFAERNLSEYNIDKTAELKWTKIDIKSKLSLNNTLKDTVVQNDHPPFSTRFAKIIFNKDLSRTNLELLLFDDKFFTPIKEAKSALNYYLFGRLPEEVAVSTDKKRLFLNITVDTSYVQSAFVFKSDQEINKIKINLVAAKGYYQSIGFIKIFLSVIPNPVSVYDNKRMHYNRLLERIESSNTFSTISLVKSYKAEKRSLYYKSDAHWNPLGLDIWVNETNRVLQGSLK